LIFIITFLLVNVYPIKLLFGKKAPTTVIGTKTDKGISDVQASKKTTKVLSDEQIQQLNDG